MEGERHRETNRKERSRRERSRGKKKGSVHWTFKELLHVLKSSKSSNGMGGYVLLLLRVGW